VAVDYRVLVNARQVQSPHGKTHDGVHSRDFRGAANGVSLLSVRAVSLSEQENIQRKETGHMAIESHLAELERRHQALEQEISEALTHPSIDALRVAELKRKKLYVKDEIARLKQDPVLH
jgi:hypothetical protein